VAGMAAAEAIVGDDAVLQLVRVPTLPTTI
jgi:hypothetical protein